MEREFNGELCLSSLFARLFACQLKIRISEPLKILGLVEEAL